MLSIKPEFVRRIFEHKKRFEFRRSIFRRHVDVVVIYATSPIRRVVGEFDVEGIIRDSIESLWERTSLYAGIEHERFIAYYNGLKTGYAIEIGEVRLYEQPLELETHFGITPPQSFAYLDFPWPLC